jgi:Ser/Thr protein kinase RdoA (MazF antagonist)
MNKASLKKVLDVYNLQLKEIITTDRGYRNKSVAFETSDNQKLNLILYKREPGIVNIINNANKVSDYLSSKEFPTRKSISINGNSILKFSSGDQLTYACLYNYLPGRTIPWEAYTKDHIKVLGMVMSNLHLEVSGLRIENSTIVSIVDILNEQLIRMLNYFSNENVIKAANSKLRITINLVTLKKYQRLLFILKKQKDQQVLHMDFVRGNILFDEVGKSEKGKELKVGKIKITGILDFEKVAYGARIIDIARTLAFLLVDCKYKESSKVKKYFLYSGYNKRGKMELPDLKYLNPLVNYFWMYDLYKFMRHNPYEYLKDNAHYLRTIENLKANKLVI